MALRKLARQALQERCLSIACPWRSQQNDSAVSAAAGIQQPFEFFKGSLVDCFDTVSVLSPENLEAGTERIRKTHEQEEISMTSGTLGRRRDLRQARKL